MGTAELVTMASITIVLFVGLNIGMFWWLFGELYIRGEKQRELRKKYPKFKVYDLFRIQFFNDLGVVGFIGNIIFVLLSIATSMTLFLSAFETMPDFAPLLLFGVWCVVIVTFSIILALRMKQYGLYIFSRHPRN